MRKLLAFVAVLVCAALAACACGTAPVAGQAPLAAPLGACGVAAPAPLAAAPLGVVGQYGVELGEPGAPEHLRAAIAIPPDVAACLVTAGSQMLVDGINGIRCALDHLIPRPAASQRLVRLDLQTVPLPPKAAGPCGK